MEEIIREQYGDFLTEDEIGFALEFYEYTQNEAITFRICCDLRRNFCGRTFGHESKTAIDYINEEMAKGVCLSLIGQDNEYFDELSVDVQDEIITLYEKYRNEEELKEKLIELLDIKSVPKKDDVKHDETVSNAIKNKAAKKADKKDNSRQSLLDRLRKYQDELNAERGNKK